MIQTDETRWTTLKREIVLQTVFDTNRRIRTASHLLVIDATETGGKRQRFKVDSAVGAALKSAVEESERGSTNKEYPLSASLKLCRDATGYSIGQGEATFIFLSLDDLKQFSESVSRRISEFVTP